MKSKNIVLSKPLVGIVLLTTIVGAFAGSLTTYAVLNLQSRNTQNELIKDFYITENAVMVSPHSLRGKMDKEINDYTLVDLRSQEEYEKEHIIGAVNIPAYKDKNTPAYEEVDRIVKQFQDLPKDKEIIVYCYSTPCMTGRKIGKMLVENGIYVKHLGIGWNEWRYFWNLWNHEHEWNSTKTEDYIWSGKEPGTPKINVNSTACPISGQFGC